MPELHYYFAYGSNMNEVRLRCRVGDFPNQVAAQLAGYSLRFNKAAKNKAGIGYANIIPARSGIVEGVLYHLTEEQIKQLDVLEGVESGHYSRLAVEVAVNGSPKAAITYIACKKYVADGLLPDETCTARAPLAHIHGYEYYG